MLAQNFKTAADLRISEAEHGALVTVLGLLEREEIPAEKFTMRTIGAPECGCAGCILGWTGVVSMAVTERLYRSAGRGNRPLDRLFYDPAAMDVRDPALAAVALRSYLTTGEANWAEAVQSSAGS